MGRGCGAYFTVALLFPPRTLLREAGGAGINTRGSPTIRTQAYGPPHSYELAARSTDRRSEVPILSGALQDRPRRVLCRLGAWTGFTSVRDLCDVHSAFRLAAVESV